MATYIQIQIQIKFGEKWINIWCRCQKAYCVSHVCAVASLVHAFKMHLLLSPPITYLLWVGMWYANMHSAIKYPGGTTSLLTHLKRQQVSKQKKTALTALFPVGAVNPMQCKHLQPAPALVRGSVLPLCHTVIQLIFSLKYNTEIGRCWQPTQRHSYLF